MPLCALLMLAIGSTGAGRICYTASKPQPRVDEMKASTLSMYPLSYLFLFTMCSACNQSEKAVVVYADDIPVAYTPGCGWEEFPEPVLATCTEPLVEGAPDLRGIWQDYSEGTSTSGRVERIEQCGNRVVITGGGVIHDMRADGTLENGVNDVSGLSCDEIRVAAEFIDDALVLTPEGMSIQVRRWLEDDELVVEHPLIAGRLRRIDALPD